MVWSGLDPDNLKQFVRLILDLTLVTTSFYVLVALIKERRAQWMLRGLLILILLLFISDRFLKLTILSFLLEKLVLISALSMAIVFQSDFRNF
jgi:DNA integrity scanning protein DisA with diadenylate cyclase activity